MKNIIYALLPLLALTLVGWFIFKWGLNPRPVGVMKASFFDAPEELGAVLYRRFFVELQENPIVVWGVDSEQTEQVRVVAGFLREAGSGAARKVFVDEELTWGGSALFSDMKVLDFQSQYEELKAQVLSELSKGPVLLLTKYAFSAQKVGMDTLSKSLKRDLDTTLFSVTHLHLALSSGQEVELSPACKVIGDKGLAELGCLSLAKSRSIYGKAAKYPQGKWVALLDQWPGNDMILYWRHKSTP